MTTSASVGNAGPREPAPTVVTPKAPNTAGTSGTPDTPTAPAISGTLNTQTPVGTPDTPDTSGTPVTPTTRVTSGTPVTLTTSESPDTPESPDTRDGRDARDDGGPQEPSRRRRAIALPAVVGVAALTLIALPFLNRGAGPTDESKTTAAEHTILPTESPAPKLADVPGGLESASAAPTTQAGKAKSPGPADSLTNRSKVPSGSAASNAVSSKAKTVAPAKTTHAAVTPQPTATATALVIYPITKLEHGTPWRTNRLQLGMQLDGNLVLYDFVQKRVLWAAGCFGEGNYAYFQDDGNLVVYNTSNYAVWASDASGYRNSALTLGADGNLFITSSGKQVWSTNTHF